MWCELRNREKEEKREVEITAEMIRLTMYWNLSCNLLPQAFERVFNITTIPKWSSKWFSYNAEEHSLTIEYRNLSCDFSGCTDTFPSNRAGRSNLRLHHQRFHGASMKACDRGTSTYLFFFRFLLSLLQRLGHYWGPVHVLHQQPCSPVT